MSDKRAQFFALAAAVCLVLAPAAPERFRNLCLWVAITYAVLALASWLDHRSRHL